MEVPCPLPVSILIKSRKSGFGGGVIRESNQAEAKRREGPGTVAGALFATNSCPKKRKEKLETTAMGVETQRRRRRKRGKMKN